MIGNYGYFHCNKTEAAILLNRLLILILLFSLSCEAHSQTTIIEGLKGKIENAGSAEEKLDYIFMLCEEKQSLDPDSHRYYVSLATNLSNSIKSDYYKDLANAERAFLLAKDQQIDSALFIVNGLLKKYEKSGKREFITKLLALQGRVLDRGFRRFDMIDANLARLQECERYKDTFCLVMTMNSMGWGYLELGKNEEALKWLQRALQLRYSDTIALKKYNCLYSNTALAFHKMGKQDSAEYYVDMAIKYGRETETLTFLANSLNFRAQILMRTDRTSMARASMDEALLIRKKLRDPYYILYDLIELAGLYTYEKNYSKSIELCKEGESIAYQSGLQTKLPEIYQLLADNYEATGNHTESMKSMRQLISIKDSLNTASAASLSDVETKYEVQKKENVIMKQQFDLTAKNYFIFGSLLLLLIVIVAAYLIFREARRRNKMKMQVMRDEEKRMALQAVTEAEEAERKRIAADLHDNLGAQANAILYSAELLQHEKSEKLVLVNDLHDTARDMLTSLRETLWALKNTEVTASDIWIRLINFSRQLGRHYSTVKIMTEGIPPPFQFTSTKALNIVFIAQEALNNAVRHSGAMNVSITSEHSENEWKLEIKDDGKGFDMNIANKKVESYGLSNMMERAEAVGGIINIETGSGKGTKIEFRVAREN